MTTKAFYIAFTYDVPSPGFITLVAPTAEIAQEKLMEMTQGYTNVKVHDCTDIDEIPMLRALFDKEQAVIAAQNAIIEHDINEAKEDGVLVEPLKN